MKDTVFREALLKTLASYGSDFKTLAMQFESKSMFDSTFTLLYKLPGAGEATVVLTKEAITLTEYIEMKHYAADLPKLLMKIRYALPGDFVCDEEEDMPTHIRYYTFYPMPGSVQKHPGFPDKFMIMTDESSTQFSIQKYR